MRLAGGILALIVGIAGWYYLFYSKAAERLGVVESPAVNQRRRWLRQTNGVVMLLLAVLLYAGLFTESPQIFLLVWLGICLLLAVVVALGIIDMWYTSKLRRKQ